VHRDYLSFENYGAHSLIARQEDPNIARYSTVQYDAYANPYRGQNFYIHPNVYNGTSAENHSVTFIDGWYPWAPKVRSDHKTKNYREISQSGVPAWWPEMDERQDPYRDFGPMGSHRWGPYIQPRPNSYRAMAPAGSCNWVTQRTWTTMPYLL